MSTISAQDRGAARTAVLDGLERLRAAFPLEARVRGASRAAQAAYAQALQQWLRATPPQSRAFAADALAELLKLDALVEEQSGLGCYPFSARDTGITVRLAGDAVNAMCAIDALAVARLGGTRAHIDGRCETCGSALAIEVEANGGLDHDQAEVARVVWFRACGTHNSCSQSLCRNIRFLCPTCEPASPGDVYTLPQATAIGNAFFAFQAAFVNGATTGA
jgi:hypothetical protein